MMAQGQPGLTFTDKLQCNFFALSPQAMLSTLAAAKRADAVGALARGDYLKEARRIYDILWDDSETFKNGGLFPAVACLMGRDDHAVLSLRYVVDYSRLPSALSGWQILSPEIVNQLKGWWRSDYRFNVGFTIGLFLLNKPDLAKRLLEAEEQTGSDPLDKAMRGILYYIQGEKEKAKETYEQLARLRKAHSDDEVFADSNTTPTDRKLALAFASLGCLLGERDYAVELASRLEEFGRFQSGLFCPQWKKPVTNDEWQREQGETNELVILMLALLGGVKIEPAKA